MLINSFLNLLILIVLGCLAFSPSFRLETRSTFIQVQCHTTIQGFCVISCHGYGVNR